MSFERWMTETTSTLAMPKATDKPDEQADQRVRGLLGVDGGEELSVGLDPAIGLDAGRRLHGLGDRLGRVDVRDGQIDGRHAADEIR